MDISGADHGFVSLRESVVIKPDRCFCVLINKKYGSVKFIYPQHAVILAMCSGNLTVGQLTEVYSLAYHIPIEDAKTVVNDALNAAKDFIQYSEEIKEILYGFKPDDFFFLYELPVRYYRQPLIEPVELVFPLTHRCNLKCIYCFRSSGEKMNGELSVNEHLDVVRQAIDLGIERCTITGGEPTISDSFWPVVELLVKNDVSVYIATNGSFMGHQAAVRLMGSGVSLVQFSYDAVSNDIFHFLVGKKDIQQQIERNLKECVKSGLEVRVKATLTRYNINEVEKLIDFIYDCGCTYLGIDAYIKGFLGRGNQELVPQDEAFLKALDIIERKKMSVAPMQVEGLFRRNQWKNEDDIVACGGGCSGFVVQPNGDVCFCEMLYAPEYVAGNIRQDSLKKIWDEKRLFRLITPQEGDTVDAICQECKYFEKCGTGCINHSLVEGRGKFGVDPRCWNYSH